MALKTHWMDFVVRTSLGPCWELVGTSLGLRWDRGRDLEARGRGDRIGTGGRADDKNLVYSIILLYTWHYKLPGVLLTHVS